MAEFERRLAEDVESRVARGEASGSVDVHVGSSPDTAIGSSASSSNKRLKATTAVESTPLQSPEMLHHDQPPAQLHHDHHENSHGFL